MNAFFIMMLSALAFSFFPLFNSYGLAVTSPILFALLNQVATLVVVICVFLVLIKSPAKALEMVKGFFSLSLENKLIAFFSGFAVYLGGVFFLFSLTLMSKAGATVIMEMRPLIALFIAPILMIEKKWDSLRPIDGLLILLSLGGLLMLTASERAMTFAQFLSDPFMMFRDQSPYAYIGIVIAFLSAFCFAFSGVSRAHFANRLPHDFRVKYFNKTESITESVYAYMMAYILGFPLSILLLIFLEPNAQMEVMSLIPALLNGFALVGTSVFFSYAILKAKNANVSLVLYFAPLLAALWLYMAGFSDITEMLVLGGGLIIISNLILITTSKKKKTQETSKND